MAETDTLADDETLDAVCGGALQLAQRRGGYRFNVDSVLLARFSASALDGDGRRVLELGLGNGVVALLVARWRPGWSVGGVELQPGLAERARRNARRNGLSLDVWEGDYRLALDGLASDSWNLVIANPPYHPVGEGRTSPDSERAGARQELHARVEDTLRAARRLVRSDGRVCLVYPASGLARLVTACAGVGLAPTRWRFVHPRPSEPAHVVLLEASPASKRVPVVESPLFLQGLDGLEAGEARRWLREPEGP